MIEKNITLGVLSSATYSLVNNDPKEIIMFGVINGLLQQFSPLLLGDNIITTSITDPIIASILQTLLISDTFSHMIKSIFAGLVATITTEIIFKL